MNDHASNEPSIAAPRPPAAAAGDEPLRVVHVMTALVLAGMEYGVIKVCNRLERDKVTPGIVCLRYEAPDARAALHDSVRVIALEEIPDRNWGLIPKIAAAFRTLRPEVVHSHNWQTYVYAVIAARMAGVPVIIHGEHGHDSTFRSWKRLLAQRALSPAVDRFVTVSKDLSRELVREWRLKPERIANIANGVDLERFTPQTRADELRRALGYDAAAKVITIIGGLRPVKGHPTLLRAFARLREHEPQARLLIVGSDYRRGHQKELETLAASLGIADAVRFENIRNDIPDVLALSDVYVNASHFEGMSNTILEAMASGKAVVATAVGGNVELIDDARTGLLVPPNDPEALAGALARVLGDPALRERIQTAARAHVVREHPLAGMARRYQDLYLETALRRRVRRSAPAGERVKRLAAATLRYAGVTALLHAARGRQLTILTYHRVLPLHEARRYPYQGMVLARDTFEHQMAHLARHYSVLPFREGVRRLETGSLPPRAIAVTFDDGYRDNAEHALPILERHGVPATFFLVTDAIERGLRPWWDEIAAVAPNDAPAIVSRLNRMARAERAEHLRRAREEQGADPTDVDGVMMGWDDVAELLRRGMSVGSHTHTHAFLDELSPEEIRSELNESFDLLERRAGSRDRWVAYPRGRALGGDRGRDLLREIGVAAAVTVQYGSNRPQADPLALRRVDAGLTRLHATFDRALFDLELSPLAPKLRRY